VTDLRVSLDFGGSGHCQALNELSIAATSQEPIPTPPWHNPTAGGVSSSICPWGWDHVRSERLHAITSCRAGAARRSASPGARSATPAPQWGTGQRATPVSDFSNCLHSARRSGRWRCPSALGIRRARDRVNRAAFWNPPLNSAGARYLGETRQWRLIRRSRSEPARLMQVVFTGRSWSADQWQQLKPTCQRSRHQAQLETRGGQIGSICAMRVSCRSRDMDISVQA
jgi:hypothetical protein